MFRIDTNYLELQIKTEFGLSCSIDFHDDPDARFSLTLQFEGFRLTASATDARVSVIMPAKEIQEVLRASLIAQLVHIRPILEAEISPFYLAVWKSRSKLYSKDLRVEVLNENSELLIEVYSGPQDVNTEKKAFNAIEQLVFKCLSMILSINSSIGEKEGSRAQYLVSKVERSAKNRSLCIALFGYNCRICGDDLTDKYGALAEKFIHVHHIEGISTMGEKWINPYSDLIPVCPNCHAMLHRKDPSLSPEELKVVLQNNLKENS